MAASWRAFNECNSIFPSPGAESDVWSPTYIVQKQWGLRNLCIHYRRINRASNRQTEQQTEIVSLWEKKSNDTLFYSVLELVRAADKPCMMYLSESIFLTSHCPKDFGSSRINAYPFLNKKLLKKVKKRTIHNRYEVKDSSETFKLSFLRSCISYGWEKGKFAKSRIQCSNLRDFRGLWMFPKAVYWRLASSNCF